MHPRQVVAILALTGLCALAPAAADDRLASPTTQPASAPPGPAPAEAQAPATQPAEPAPEAEPRAAPGEPRARSSRERRPLSPRGVPQRDPKAEVILRALLDANGGEDYLRGVQSLFVRARQILGEGEEARESLVTQYWKAPNRYRWEVDIEGGIIVMSYNGRYGWFDNGQGVTLAPKSEYRHFDDFSREINEPLSHLDPGNWIGYEGERDVEGRKVDVVLVTRPTGSMKRLFIDRETHRVLQKEVARFNEPDKIVARWRFSDYRQVDRRWIPYLERDLNAEVPSRRELVDFIPNQAIDDRVFDSPVPPLEETLREAPPPGSR